MTAEAPLLPPAAADPDDPRTHRAWRLYADSLRDLDGREYEEAEPVAWERLERMLGEIPRDPASAG